MAMKLAGVAVFVLAFVRPPEALLLVAGLAPLGVLYTRLWHSSPTRGSEALVLAFLAGWFLRTWRPTKHQAGPGDNLSTPALLFGAVVVVTCAVQLVMWQVWSDYPWPFTQRVSLFLARDYLLGPGSFGFLATAALLLEGPALFLAVVLICRQDGTFAPRLTRVVVAGAVGAALLNFAYVAMGTVGSGADWAEALPVALAQRWTIHVADVNAAGSYFVLVAPIAIGAAAAWNRWSVAWLGAGLMVALARWLTGSRVAIAAGLITLLVVAVGKVVTWRCGSQGLVKAVTATVIVTIVGGAIVRIVIGGSLPSRSLASTHRAVSQRVELAQAGLAMLAVRPAFGVGIGQFYAMSGRFAQLPTSRRGENAHNNLLQISAELGLVGLTGFLWLIGSALRRGWRALGPGVRPYLVGTMAGLTAFFLTCLK